MIEVSEIVLHEGDEPDLVVDLLDADVLTGEDGGEVDFLPADAAAALKKADSTRPGISSGGPGEAVRCCRNR